MEYAKIFFDKSILNECEVYLVTESEIICIFKNGINWGDFTTSTFS